MIRQHSQGLRPKERPISAFGEKLKEALERAKSEPPERSQ